MEASLSKVEIFFTDSSYINLNTIKHVEKKGSIKKTKTIIFLHTFLLFYYQIKLVFRKLL